MSVNYTQDQVERMVNLYRINPSRETVENLAEEMNKSIKSIIGKLSREGVYEKTVYKTKTGDDPVTKKELVEELSELVGIEYSMISGLEKSPKIDLKRLVDILKED